MHNLALCQNENDEHYQVSFCAAKAAFQLMPVLDQLGRQRPLIDFAK